MVGTTNAPSPNAITNSNLNILINGTNKLTYNGTADKSIDITLASIGAAASGHNHDSVYSKLSHNHDSVYAKTSHTHSYLPLSGGTMAGSITMNANNLYFSANRIPILLRFDNTNYTGGIGWDTNGGECMAFLAKHTNTRFKFKIGMDPLTFTNNSLSNTESEFDIFSGGAKTNGSFTAKSYIATDSGFKDTALTMSVSPMRSNEVNFGGTSTSDVIYFGYRAIDSRPIPTKFVFGGAQPGSASVLAGDFYVANIRASLPAAQSSAPSTKMLWTY